MGAALGREVVDNDLHPFGQRAVTAVAIDKANRVTNITSWTLLIGQNDLGKNNYQYRYYVKYHKSIQVPSMHKYKQWA